MDHCPRTLPPIAAKSIAPSAQDSSIPEDGLGSPAISLIVTTYTEDRLENIAQLLESVQKQTLRDIEFIFVGEGTPHLCEQVRRLAPGGSRGLEVFFNAGRTGLSSARNVGIAHAKGRIIAFVDDDVVLLSDWAEKLVDTFAADRSIIGVAGSALPLWEDPSMAWLPEEFHWLISCTGWFDGGRGSSLRNAWGMNMAFRREAFAHAMFDERLGGNKGARDGSKLGLLAEDTVFSLRVRQATRGRIVYNPDVRVHHKVSRYRLTSRYIRRRAYWEGYTKAVLRRESAVSGGNNRLEQGLLKRIMVRFLARTLRQMLLSPSVGLHRFTFAIDTLFYVALGYVSGTFTLLGTLTRPRFER